MTEADGWETVYATGWPQTDPWARRAIALHARQLGVVYDYPFLGPSAVEYLKKAFSPEQLAGNWAAHPEQAICRAPLASGGLCLRRHGHTGFCQ